MPLRVAWRPVHEPTWDEFHVISPRDAALYVFPRAYWDGDARSTRLEAIGLLGSEQVVDLSSDVCAQDAIPRYPDPPPRAAALLETGFRGLHAAARLFGIRRLLPLLASRVASGSATVEEVLGRVKAWEGRQHTGRCLPRAIARWSLLVANGHRPAMVLGVATPAARMHAWVVLDGRHVGEDPDEVAAYEPAVRYDAVGTTT